MPAKVAPSVLCVDDDRDIAEIVQAMLTDEGYRVSCLYAYGDAALMRTVGQLEPDCVLLDSGSSIGYDNAWIDAAGLALRRRSIPTIMFTAHIKETAEARAATTRRAKAAQFAAVLDEPFSIDELLAAVAEATGHSIPFDRSPAGDAKRTKALVKALKQRGATDIQPSAQREWAIFRDEHGRLVQLYWWQGRGVYEVGRFEETGQMTMLGQFIDRDAAIDAALSG